MKKVNKKLTLNKERIASLENEQQRYVFGGDAKTDIDCLSAYTDYCTESKTCVSKAKTCTYITKEDCLTKINCCSAVVVCQYKTESCAL